MCEQFSPTILLHTLTFPLSLFPLMPPFPSFIPFALPALPNIQPGVWWRAAANTFLRILSPKIAPGRAIFCRRKENVENEFKLK